MAWRLAASLAKLCNQVNAKWPARSKNSDGSIGDAEHASRARASDHNPWISDNGVGVVSAVDITHDPRGGFDSYAFGEMLLRNKDNRIKYVISNRKIAAGSEGPSPWMWRRYTGVNPHDHHIHISVKSQKMHYDNTAEWKLDGIILTPQPEYKAPPQTLRNGMKGDLVELLQSKLGVTVDGDFGPLTEAAVKAFQRDRGLVVDGICGPQVWGKL